MYVCMYLCMREYDPQVGNDTSGQGDLLIDILQENLKGSYRRPGPGPHPGHIDLRVETDT